MTDCHQPAERAFRLTRACLEVAFEFKQPIGIVTKNVLALRDLGLLSQMAPRNLVQAYVSVTTLDADLTRAMEPRTGIPSARLRAIKTLAEARVPVGVMTAPVIPGLNDHELPGILKAARAHGARDAGYVLLRLPLTVEPVFREWLHREQPSKAKKVQRLIRQTRGGNLNQSTYGERMKGSGEIAEQIRTMFQIFRQKLGFKILPDLDFTRCQSPRRKGQQLTLF